MKRISPEVQVIDVTHGLIERDVLGGALVLRNTMPYMPYRCPPRSSSTPVSGTATAGRPAQPRRPALRRSRQRPACARRRAALRRRRRGPRASNEEVCSSRSRRPSTAARLRPGGARSRPACPRRGRRPVAAASSTDWTLPEPRVTATGSSRPRWSSDCFGNVSLNLSPASSRRPPQRARRADLRRRALSRPGGAHVPCVRASDIVVLIDSYGQVSVAVMQRGRGQGARSRDRGRREPPAARLTRARSGLVGEHDRRAASVRRCCAARADSL